MCEPCWKKTRLGLSSQTNQPDKGCPSLLFWSAYRCSCTVSRTGHCIMENRFCCHSHLECDIILSRRVDVWGDKQKEKKIHLYADIGCTNPQTQEHGYKGQVISCLQRASRQRNLYHSILFTQPPVTSTKTSQDKIRGWSADLCSVMLYREYWIVSMAKPSGKTQQLIRNATQLGKSQVMHQISNLFRLNKGRVLLAWD